MHSKSAFSFSVAVTPAPTAAGQPGNFESTTHGFNTAQYTSISAGSSPHETDLGPSSHSRFLSPLSKRSTGAENGNEASQGRKTSYAVGHHKMVQMHRPRINLFRRMSDGTRRFGAKLKHMDPVKLAYLRTSFVFAISVLVTWTPSSINRVYTLIYPDRASYGLNIAAAVVLPLQGVWNAVIYFTTSWTIFREEMEGTRTGKKLFGLVGLGSSHMMRGADGARHGGSGRQFSGGSLALGSSISPRSEMGRNRRLEDDGSHVDGEEMEMQSHLSSPKGSHMRRMHPTGRPSTMRVTQKQFEDLS